MKMTALAAAALLASAPDFTRSADNGTALERGPPPSAQMRSGDFQPTTYDAENRTVELILSLGARVKRWGFNEELEISAGAIDLSRVEGGKVPLLNTHSRWSIGDILGQVLSTRIETIEGVPALIAVVRFADTDAGREAEGMVSRGELKGVSIGYNVLKWALVPRAEGEEKDDNDTWRATSWVLLEASLVPIPADAGAGVRSEPAPTPENTDQGARADQEDDQMLKTRNGLLRGNGAPLAAPNNDQGGGTAEPAPSPGATDERAAPTGFSGAEAVAFVEQGRSLGIEQRANELVTQADVGTISVEAARSELLRSAAEAQAARTAPAAGGAARVTEDDRDKQREAITNALEHRYNPSVELTDGGRQYRGMSLMEIARRNLERNGERNVSGLAPMELAGRALSRSITTSDLPAVVGGLGQRSLRAGYEGANGSHRVWARETTATNFKQIERIQFGSAARLLEVPEGGEFKMGSLNDGKEVYSLATFGRRLPISRKVIVNDDLDAMTRIPFMLGQSAARFETDSLYAILKGNPLMGDGTALFHASRGNYDGTGAALSEASLEAAELAMGSQVGLDGEALNIEPKYLIVSRRDRVKAEKLLAAILANTSGSVNVFANRGLQLVVEQRLNALAGGKQPWFMAAEHGQIDTVEFAYLEGERGVVLEQRDGFEVDGLEFKARLDFAAKAIDGKGIYCNSGATVS